MVDQAETITCLWVVEDRERFVLEAFTAFAEDGSGEPFVSRMVMSLDLFQGR